MANAQSAQRQASTGKLFAIRARANSPPVLMMIAKEPDDGYTAGSLVVCYSCCCIKGIIIILSVILHSVNTI